MPKRKKNRRIEKHGGDDGSNVGVSPEQPSSEQGETRTDAEQNAQIERLNRKIVWAWIASAFGPIVALFGLYLTFLQWKAADSHLAVMRAQLKDAREGAEQSRKDATEIAAKQIRPWLSIDKAQPYSLGDPEVKMIVANRGQSIAINPRMVLDYYMFPTSKRGGAVLHRGGYGPAARNGIGMGTSFPAGAKSEIFAPGPTLNATEIQQIKQGTYTLEMHLGFIYTDTFDNKHDLRPCMLYHVASVHWDRCPGWNDDWQEREREREREEQRKRQAPGK